MFARLIFAMLLVVSVASWPSARAENLVDVRVGHSELLVPAATPSTIVLGNPVVADVTIANASLIITGKEVGVTNLILLDQEGLEMYRAVIRVNPLDRDPQFTVRVIEGGSRDHGRMYLCGPRPGCAPTDETGRRIGAALPEQEDPTSPVNIETELLQ